MTRSTSILRAIGWAEGISFLLLLGVAMPLKYLAGKPIAVRIAGLIHGALFVVFCAALLNAHLRGRWPLGRSAGIFVSALIPFGPFLMDRRLRHTDA